jgi:hypothetical protein
MIVEELQFFPNETTGSWEEILEDSSGNQD